MISVCDDAGKAYDIFSDSCPIPPSIAPSPRPHFNDICVCSSVQDNLNQNTEANGIVFGRYSWETGDYKSGYPVYKKIIKESKATATPQAWAEVSVGSTGFWEIVLYKDGRSRIFKEKPTLFLNNTVSKVPQDVNDLGWVDESENIAYIKIVEVSGYGTDCDCIDPSPSVPACSYEQNICVSNIVMEEPFNPSDGSLPEENKKYTYSADLNGTYTLQDDGCAFGGRPMYVKPIQVKSITYTRDQPPSNRLSKKITYEDMSAAIYWDENEGVQGRWVLNMIEAEYSHVDYGIEKIKEIFKSFSTSYSPATLYPSSWSTSSPREAFEAYYDGQPIIDYGVACSPSPSPAIVCVCVSNVVGVYGFKNPNGIYKESGIISDKKRFSKIDAPEFTIYYDDSNAEKEFWAIHNNYDEDLKGLVAVSHRNRFEENPYDVFSWIPKNNYRNEDRIIVESCSCPIPSPSPSVSPSPPPPLPDCPETDCAITVNGYFPLYETERQANEFHPNGDGTSHSHDLNGTTYYMPNGLTMGQTQFHGNYKGLDEYCCDGECKSFPKCVTVKNIGFKATVHNPNGYYKYDSDDVNGKPTYKDIKEKYKLRWALAAEKWKVIRISDDEDVITASDSEHIPTDVASWTASSSDYFMEALFPTDVYEDECKEYVTACVFGLKLINNVDLDLTVIGEYNQAGIHHDRPFYRKADGGNCVIMWEQQIDTASSMWRLVDISQQFPRTIAYSRENTETPGSVTNYKWTVNPELWTTHQKNIFVTDDACPCIDCDDDDNPGVIIWPPIPPEPPEPPAPSPPAVPSTSPITITPSASPRPSAVPECVCVSNVQDWSNCYFSEDINGVYTLSGFFLNYPVYERGKYQIRVYGSPINWALIDTNPFDIIAEGFWNEEILCDNPSLALSWTRESPDHACTNSDLRKDITVNECDCKEKEILCVNGLYDSNGDWSKANTTYIEDGFNGYPTYASNFLPHGQFRIFYRNSRWEIIFEPLGDTYNDFVEIMVAVQDSAGFTNSPELINPWLPAGEYTGDDVTVRKVAYRTDCPGEPSPPPEPSPSPEPSVSPGPSVSPSPSPSPLPCDRLCVFGIEDTYREISIEPAPLIARQGIKSAHATGTYIKVKNEPQSEKDIPKTKNGYPVWYIGSNQSTSKDNLASDVYCILKADPNYENKSYWVIAAWEKKEAINKWGFRYIIYGINSQNLDCPADVSSWDNIGCQENDWSWCQISPEDISVNRIGDYWFYPYCVPPVSAAPSPMCLCVEDFSEPYGNYGNPNGTYCYDGYSNHVNNKPVFTHKNDVFQIVYDRKYIPTVLEGGEDRLPKTVCLSGTTESKSSAFPWNFSGANGVYTTFAAKEEDPSLFMGKPIYVLDKGGNKIRWGDGVETWNDHEHYVFPVYDGGPHFGRSMKRVHLKSDSMYIIWWNYLDNRWQITNLGYWQFLRKSRYTNPPQSINRTNEISFDWWDSFYHYPDNGPATVAWDLNKTDVNYPYDPSIQWVTPGGSIYSGEPEVIENSCKDWIIRPTGPAALEIALTEPTLRPPLVGHTYLYKGGERPADVPLPPEGSNNEAGEYNWKGSGENGYSDDDFNVGHEVCDGDSYIDPPEEIEPSTSPSPGSTCLCVTPKTNNVQVKGLYFSGTYCDFEKFGEYLHEDYNLDDVLKKKPYKIIQQKNSMSGALLTGDYISVSGAKNAGRILEKRISSENTRNASVLATSSVNGRYEKVNDDRYTQKDAKGNIASCIVREQKKWIIFARKWCEEDEVENFIGVGGGAKDVDEYDWIADDEEYQGDIIGYIFMMGAVSEGLPVYISNEANKDSPTDCTFVRCSEKGLDAYYNPDEYQGSGTGFYTGNITISSSDNAFGWTIVAFEGDARLQDNILAWEALSDDNGGASGKNPWDDIEWKTSKKISSYTVSDPLVLKDACTTPSGPTSPPHLPSGAPPPSPSIGPQFVDTICVSGLVKNGSSWEGNGTYTYEGEVDRYETNAGHMAFPVYKKGDYTIKWSGSKIDYEDATNTFGPVDNPGGSVPSYSWRIYDASSPIADVFSIEKDRIFDYNLFISVWEDFEKGHAYYFPTMWEKWHASNLGGVAIVQEGSCSEVTPSAHPPALCLSGIDADLNEGDTEYSSKAGPPKEYIFSGFVNEKPSYISKTDTDIWSLSFSADGYWELSRPTITAPTLVMNSTEDVYSPDLVTSWTIVQQEEYFEIGIFDGSRFVASEIKFATGLCSPAPSAITTPPTTVSPSPPPTSCSAAPECASSFSTNFCVSGITGPFSYMNGNYIASTKWLVPWNWTDWFTLAITEFDYEWPNSKTFGDPNSGEFACGLELTMVDGYFEHGGLSDEFQCHLPGMALLRGAHAYLPGKIPLDDGTYDVKSSHGNYFSYCAKMPLVPNYIHEDDLEHWNSSGPLSFPTNRKRLGDDYRGIFYHVNFIDKSECRYWDSTKEKRYKKYIGTWVLAGPSYTFFDRYSYLSNPQTDGYSGESIEYASFSSGECPAIRPEEPEIYSLHGYYISPYFRQDMPSSVACPDSFISIDWKNVYKDYIDNWYSKDVKFYKTLNGSLNINQPINSGSDENFYENNSPPWVKFDAVYNIGKGLEDEKSIITNDDVTDYDEKIQMVMNSFLNFQVTSCALPSVPPTSVSPSEAPFFCLRGMRDVSLDCLKAKDAWGDPIYGYSYWSAVIEGTYYKTEDGTGFGADSEKTIWVKRGRERYKEVDVWFAHHKNFNYNSISFGECWVMWVNSGQPLNQSVPVLKASFIIGGSSLGPWTIHPATWTALGTGLDISCFNEADCWYSKGYRVHDVKNKSEDPNAYLQYGPCFLDEKDAKYAGDGTWKEVSLAQNDGGFISDVTYYIPNGEINHTIHKTAKFGELVEFTGDSGLGVTYSTSGAQNYFNSFEICKPPPKTCELNFYLNEKCIPSPVPSVITPPTTPIDTKNICVKGANNIVLDEALMEAAQSGENWNSENKNANVNGVYTRANTRQSGKYRWIKKSEGQNMPNLYIYWNIVKKHWGIAHNFSSPIFDLFNTESTEDIIESEHPVNFAFKPFTNAETIGNLTLTHGVCPPSPVPSVPPAPSVSPSPSTEPSVIPEPPEPSEVPPPVCLKADGNFECYDKNALQYLLEIGFGTEFDNNTALFPSPPPISYLLKKWKGGVKISPHWYDNLGQNEKDSLGSVATEDEALVKSIIEELNSLKNEYDPDLNSNVHFSYNETEVFDNAEIHIFFTTQSRFKILVPQAMPGQGSAVAPNQFILWTENNGKIYKAAIFIERSYTGDLRKHLIREELTQSIGLANDSTRYPDSMFYQKESTTTSFSDIDRKIISMLYYPKVQYGMDEDRVAREFTRTCSIPTGAYFYDKQLNGRNSYTNGDNVIYWKSDTNEWLVSAMIRGVLSPIIYSDKESQNNWETPDLVGQGNWNAVDEGVTGINVLSNEEGNCVSPSPQTDYESLPAIPPSPNTCFTAENGLCLTFKARKNQVLGPCGEDSGGAHNGSPPPSAIPPDPSICPAEGSITCVKEKFDIYWHKGPQSHSGSSIEQGFVNLRNVLEESLAANNGSFSRMFELKSAFTIEVLKHPLGFNYLIVTQDNPIISLPGQYAIYIDGQTLSYHAGYRNTGLSEPFCFSETTEIIVKFAPDNENDSSSVGFILPRSHGEDSFSENIFKSGDWQFVFKGVPHYKFTGFEGEVGTPPGETEDTGQSGGTEISISYHGECKKEYEEPKFAACDNLSLNMIYMSWIKGDQPSSWANTDLEGVSDAFMSLSHFPDVFDSLRFYMRTPYVQSNPRTEIDTAFLSDNQLIIPGRSSLNFPGQYIIPKWESMASSRMFLNNSCNRIGFFAYESRDYGTAYSTNHRHEKGELRYDYVDYEIYQNQIEFAFDKFGVHLTQDCEELNPDNPLTVEKVEGKKNSMDVTVGIFTTRKGQKSPALGIPFKDDMIFGGRVETTGCNNFWEIEILEVPEGLFELPESSSIKTVPEGDGYSIKFRVTHYGDYDCYSQDKFAKCNSTVDPEDTLINNYPESPTSNNQLATHDGLTSVSESSSFELGTLGASPTSSKYKDIDEFFEKISTSRESLVSSIESKYAKIHGNESVSGALKKIPSKDYESSNFGKENLNVFWNGIKVGIDDTGLVLIDSPSGVTAKKSPGNSYAIDLTFSGDFKNMITYIAMSPENQQKWKIRNICMPLNSIENAVCTGEESAWRIEYIGDVRRGASSFQIEDVQSKRYKGEISSNYSANNSVWQIDTSKANDLSANTIWYIEYIGPLTYGILYHPEETRYDTPVVRKFNSGFSLPNKDLERYFAQFDKQVFDEKLHLDKPILLNWPGWTKSTTKTHIESEFEIEIMGVDEDIYTKIRDDDYYVGRNIGNYQKGWRRLPDTSVLLNVKGGLSRIESSPELSRNKITNSPHKVNLSFYSIGNYDGREWPPSTDEKSHNCSKKIDLSWGINENWSSEGDYLYFNQKPQSVYCSYYANTGIQVIKFLGPDKDNDVIPAFNEMMKIGDSHRVTAGQIDGQTTLKKNHDWIYKITRVSKNEYEVRTNEKFLSATYTNKKTFKENKRNLWLKDNPKNVSVRHRSNWGMIVEFTGVLSGKSILPYGSHGDVFKYGSVWNIGNDKNQWLLGLEKDGDGYEKYSSYILNDGAASITVLQKGFGDRHNHYRSQILAIPNTARETDSYKPVKINVRGGGLRTENSGIPDLKVDYDSTLFPEEFEINWLGDIERRGRISSELDGGIKVKSLSVGMVQIEFAGRYSGTDWFPYYNSRIYENNNYSLRSLKRTSDISWEDENGITYKLINRGNTRSTRELTNSGWVDDENPPLAQSPGGPTGDAGRNKGCSEFDDNVCFQSFVGTTWITRDGEESEFMSIKNCIDLQVSEQKGLFVANEDSLPDGIFVSGKGGPLSVIMNFGGIYTNRFVKISRNDSLEYKYLNNPNENLGSVDITTVIITYTGDECEAGDLDLSYNGREIFEGIVTKGNSTIITGPQSVENGEWGIFNLPTEWKPSAPEQSKNNIFFGVNARTPAIGSAFLQPGEWYDVQFSINPKSKQITYKHKPENEINWSVSTSLKYGGEEVKNTNFPVAVGQGLGASGPESWDLKDLKIYDTPCPNTTSVDFSSQNTVWIITNKRSLNFIQEQKIKWNSENGESGEITASNILDDSENPIMGSLLLEYDSPAIKSVISGEDNGGNDYEIIEFKGELTGCKVIPDLSELAQGSAANARMSFNILDFSSRQNWVSWSEVEYATALDVGHELLGTMTLFWDGAVVDLDATDVPGVVVVDVIDKKKIRIAFQGEMDDKIINVQPKTYAGESPPFLDTVYAVPREHIGNIDNLNSSGYTIFDFEYIGNEYDSEDIGVEIVRLGSGCHSPSKGPKKMPNPCLDYPMDGGGTDSDVNTSPKPNPDSSGGQEGPSEEVLPPVEDDTQEPGICYEEERDIQIVVNGLSTNNDNNQPVYGTVVSNQGKLKIGVDRVTGIHLISPPSGIQVKERDGCNIVVVFRAPNLLGKLIKTPDVDSNQITSKLICCPKDSWKISNGVPVGFTHACGDTVIKYTYVGDNCPKCDDLDGTYPLPDIPDDGSGEDEEDTGPIFPEIPADPSVSPTPITFLPPPVVVIPSIPPDVITPVPSPILELPPIKTIDSTHMCCDCDEGWIIVDGKTQELKDNEGTYNTSPAPDNKCKSGPYGPAHYHSTVVFVHAQIWYVIIYRDWTYEEVHTKETFEELIDEGFRTSAGRLITGGTPASPQANNSPMSDNEEIVERHVYFEGMFYNGHLVNVKNLPGPGAMQNSNTFLAGGIKPPIQPDLFMGGPQGFPQHYMFNCGGCNVVQNISSNSGGKCSAPNDTKTSLLAGCDSKSLSEILELDVNCYNLIGAEHTIPTRRVACGGKVRLAFCRGPCDYWWAPAGGANLGGGNCKSGTEDGSYNSELGGPTAAPNLPKDCPIGGGGIWEKIGSLHTGTGKSWQFSTYSYRYTDIPYQKYDIQSYHDGVREGDDNPVIKDEKKQGLRDQNDDSPPECRPYWYEMASHCYDPCWIGTTGGPDAALGVDGVYEGQFSLEGSHSSYINGMPQGIWQNSDYQPVSSITPNKYVAPSGKLFTYWPLLGHYENQCFNSNLGRCIENMEGAYFDDPAFMGSSMAWKAYNSDSSWAAGGCCECTGPPMGGSVSY